MVDWRNFSATKKCLDGKKIAIIGAGSGIGYTLAKKFASYGATVLLVGRTIKKLINVYDEIESNGYPQAAIIPIDLEHAVDTDYQEMQDCISIEFGKLDGLIHSAAELGQQTSICNYSLLVWEKLIKVNVNAAFAITKYCLPLLQKSDSGSILFTSSSVGLKGKAYWGAYAVSKAAIENLMQVLADELEGISKVRVNTINPGPTRTDMRAQAFPAENPITVKSAEDLVPLYLYFMINESIGVTGQQISY